MATVTILTTKDAAQHLSLRSNPARSQVVTDIHPVFGVDDIRENVGQHNDYPSDRGDQAQSHSVLQRSQQIRSEGQRRQSQDYGQKGKDPLGWPVPMPHQGVINNTFGSQGHASD